MIPNSRNRHVKQQIRRNAAPPPGRRKAMAPAPADFGHLNNPDARALLSRWQAENHLRETQATDAKPETMPASLPTEQFAKLAAEAADKAAPSRHLKTNTDLKGK